MRIINDFFILSVDQKYESSVTKSGLTTLNTAYQNDEVIERFANKRLYGFIESVPIVYTRSIIDLVDPGTPAPRMYISGDYIESKAKRGYKIDNRSYSCATWEGFKTITIADIATKCDIRRGDKVYFDPGVTEPDNSLGPFGKRELYKAGCNEIICSIRDGEIIMQGDWCLVEPNVETWEDISIPTPVILNGKPMTNPDGSVRMRTKEEWIVKKSQPENKPLEAFMRYFSPFCDLQQGDKIIYNYGANWPVKVEGVEYFAVQRDDILCKSV